MAPRARVAFHPFIWRVFDALVLDPPQEANHPYPAARQRRPHGHGVRAAVVPAGRGGHQGGVASTIKSDTHILCRRVSGSALRDVYASGGPPCHLANRPLARWRASIPPRGRRWGAVSGQVATSPALPRLGPGGATAAHPPPLAYPAPRMARSLSPGPCRERTSRARAPPTRTARATAEPAARPRAVRS
jgi:hypothetical protein